MFDLGSIRDPSEVLASRKSLLALRKYILRETANSDRTPQKTYLKSPAVRVQTPKQSKLESPSRVKRMLPFTELDNDFDDPRLNDGVPFDADPTDSPTMATKSIRRKGLTQQTKPKPFTLQDSFKAPERDEVVNGFESDGDLDIPHDNGFGHDSDDGGFGDDPYAQSEDDQPLQELNNDDARESESEEDIYGEQPIKPTIKPSKGRAPSTSKPSKQPPPKSGPLKRTAKQSKKATSSQPIPKRTKRTSVEPPRILQRKEKPELSDISIIEGGGTFLNKRVYLLKSVVQREYEYSHWHTGKVNVSCMN
jgi:hypothetical protein